MSDFGESSWEEKDSSSGKDIYMRLEQGDNFVRILTQPYKYSVYFYGADEKGKGGSRIIACEDGSKDPIKALGIKPKIRFLMGVIDRKTNSYKILDTAYSVYKSLKNFSGSPKWGNPTGYDINIKVDKNGAPSDYYSVLPDPKEPLSEADRKFLDCINLEDLKKRTEPLPVERMIELMEIIDRKRSSSGSPNKTNHVEKQPEVVAQKVTREEVEKQVDSSDIDFPSFDG
jgi:hypothetical protein